MNAVIKDMYGSFFKSIAKWATSSVCYSKIVLFFIQKEYVIEDFVLEKTQGSINSC